METIARYKEVYIYGSFLMVSHNCMRTLMDKLKVEEEDRLNLEIRRITRRIRQDEVSFRKTD
jgi:hypothetical protein